MGAGNDGVDPLVGVCAVGALSMNLQTEGVCACIAYAFKKPHLTGRQVRIHVDSDDTIHIRILKYTGCDHFRGAGHHLFSRLENEFDVSLKLLRFF